LGRVLGTFGLVRPRKPLYVFVVVFRPTEVDPENETAG
jgi:hypothetical protein